MSTKNALSCLMGEDLIHTSYQQSGGSRLHQQVAAVDSLRAAVLLQEVPALNQRADVGGLVALLHQLVPDLQVPPDWGFADAAAAMRDVGIVLGSLRRHGEQPLEWMPQLEPWLLRLGELTSLPPRDTLLHYTLWNPDDALRTYTDLPEEAALIQAVKLAFPALEQAISELTTLFGVSLADPFFAIACARIETSIARVRDAAVLTYQQVDRRVFITAIRPYFEPITVAGRTYLGPGAVAMPLFVFEHLLWSAPLKDPQYLAFKQSYLPTTLPYLRTLYDRHSEVGSLLDQLLPQLANEDVVRASATRHSLDRLQRIFALINGFRAVHLRMAQQAYNQGPGEFKQGSGGYAPDMLVHIQELSRQAQERLRPFLQLTSAVANDPDPLRPQLEEVAACPMP